MNLLTRIHLLLCIISICTSTMFTTPIVFRSYSINTPHEVCGNLDMIYTASSTKNFGTISAAIIGGNSFNPHQIAHCLLGIDSSCDTQCPQISISGSHVVNRNATDWLADYFGLAPDFQSTIRISPHVRSILADLCGFWQLNTLFNGLSLRVHAPIAWCQCNLNMQEMVSNPGIVNYNAGYFSPKLVKRINLVDSFTEFMAGATPEFQLDYLITDTTQPFITWDPICVNRIINTNNTVSKLADLRIIAQYALTQSQRCQINIGIIGAIPSGNKLNTRTIFEPIVGNGHHWELGGAANAHYTFWQSQDTLTYYSLYLDVQASHLFASTQARSFDLCGKPNSKYMLAQKLQSNVASNPHLGGDSDAGYEFGNEYSSVANLTKRYLSISIPVQVEATAMLNGDHDTFNWNIGYNFWYRDCEKYSALKFQCTPSTDCDGCTDLISSTLPANTWALKGDACVFGFELSIDAPLISLAATQSKATIHSGTNNFVGEDPTMGGIDGIPPSDNPGIDNRILAVTTNADPVLDFVLFDQIYTSTPPLFLSESDIDFESARGKGLTHSAFASINYVWNNKKQWTPYIGLGAQAEFAPTSDGTCGSCMNCALSQWNVWLKTGVEFN